MFEKETRLKIEWQDPKQWEILTHVCCPRRWIMLASTYWTCLSKNYLYPASLSMPMPKMHHKRKKQGIFGKHLGLINLPLAYHFDSFCHWLRNKKTCRLPHFRTRQSLATVVAFLVQVTKFWWRRWRDMKYRCPPHESLEEKRDLLEKWWYLDGKLMENVMTYIPGPSKGCQMVPKGCQFTIP